MSRHEAVVNTGRAARPRGGLADKRRSILAGALTVFARDGYTRASIDAISTAAKVSTRTIYNHFEDKAALFEAVIQHSATQVADDQIAIIDRHFHKVTDLEADLVAFGLALAEPMTAEQAAHFALVRQINAETGHIPQAAIAAWLETGPMRVQRELAGRLQQLSERGLLQVPDPDRAALHLMLLISAADPAYRGAPPGEGEPAAAVRAGVRTFLHGHLS
jgi:AcrR family transcriptional regulator